MVGTNKGVRVARVSEDGSSLTLGPLLFDYNYTGFTTQGVTDFVSTGNYVFAATTSQEDAVKNAILVRIDLSAPFEDGTFAYSYDLQYQSDEDSYGVGVLFADNRLHLIVNEGSSAGEIQTEKLSQKRSSGWLQTGAIRYSTVEPKFFKYIQTRGLVASEDSIAVQTVSTSGSEYDITTLDSTSINQNIGISQPTGKQEFISIKYTFNNGSPFTNSPVLQSYQVKAIPGVPRQRLYQYPLSCFDIEMDKYNSQFGYKDRAYEILAKLEQLETEGDFVTIKDYRTNESFQGVIEEVRFTNESSPDKDSNGFGGLLLVTVRKL
jgi:hypothetical protein